MFFAIFYPILTFSTILFNSGILAAFWKEKGLRSKPSDLLILCLALVDFLHGVVLLPVTSHQYFVGRWVLGETTCRIFIGIEDVIEGTSLLLLGAISWDRLLLVTLEYPKYLKTQSKFRVKITVIICLVINILIAVIEVSIWDYSKHAKEVPVQSWKINFDISCLSPPRRITSFQIVLIMSLLCPVFFIIISSVAFIVLLHRRLQKSRRITVLNKASDQNVLGSNLNGMVGLQLTNVQQDSRSQVSAAKRSSAVSLPPVLAPTHKVGRSRSSAPAPAPAPAERFGMVSQGAKASFNYGVQNRYIKPAITLGALVIAMVLCFMPYNMYVIIIARICQRKCYHPRLMEVFTLLIFCKPLFDAVFYGITQSRIKRFYNSRLKLLKRKLCWLCWNFAIFVTYMQTWNWPNVTYYSLVFRYYVMFLQYIIPRRVLSCLNKKYGDVYAWPLELDYRLATQNMHPPGNFWRPLFFESLSIGKLILGCLQKSSPWVKRRGRFFPNGLQNTIYSLITIQIVYFYQICSTLWPFTCTDVTYRLI